MQDGSRIVEANALACWENAGWGEMEKYKGSDNSGFQLQLHADVDREKISLSGDED